jgi:HPt (histidine-containing phosphotransfer) domain-containing protein
MFAVRKSSAAPSDLIDQTVLQGLREIFGPRSATLLARTRQMVAERVETLGRMAEAGPDDRLARLAHEIGGMAGQVGMKRLSRDALALERLCRTGDLVEIRTATAALGKLAAASLAALPRA